jgi:hypothetical protein|tara:strand:- start:1108 stop:1341 length:234 start_codon:yes stop_codon:yes gene_type:complete
MFVLAGCAVHSMHAGIQAAPSIDAVAFDWIDRHEPPSVIVNAMHAARAANVCEIARIKGWGFALYLARSRIRVPALV